MNRNREARAMRDERERRDGRDGWEHRVRDEPTCDVRGSTFRKPRTSDLEPSRLAHLVYLVCLVCLVYLVERN